MRLIDADEVINIAKNTYTEEDVLKIAWLLCHTPTAYDVDKVVEQLEKYQTSYESGFGELTDELVFRVIENLISIVRKGGAE